jgi:V/A-type H+-transporting ATPase subunit D
MIKFQYNKTSLNDMSKQLRMRTRALPTIKSKESALRLEVKKARDEAQRYAGRLESLMARYDYMVALWGEFDPELLKVKDLRMRVSKIAGVRIPVLDEVVFEQKPYDLFCSPLWIADGIDVLKELAETGLQRELLTRRMELLDRARKKTTQKVNLYEKVQIPGYQEAMLKIKRFLEDEENLSKSSQKIVKNRQQQQQQNDGTP